MKTWPAKETSRIAGGDLTLFHYWRSSSSWRVRMALAIKGLSPRLEPVSLLDGESESSAHRDRPGDRTPANLIDADDDPDAFCKQGAFEISCWGRL